MVPSPNFPTDCNRDNVEYQHSFLTYFKPLSVHTDDGVNEKGSVCCYLLRFLFTIYIVLTSTPTSVILFPLLLWTFKNPGRIFDARDHHKGHGQHIQKMQRDFSVVFPVMDLLLLS